jgi:hypothetical protein
MRRKKGGGGYKKKKASARLTFFAVRMAAYFRPAASRSSWALSVFSHGKWSRPK